MSLHILQKLDSAEIRQRTADGFLNVQDMCDACGKQWSHYIGMKQTTAFMQSLSGEYNLGDTTRIDQDGVWIHPRAAIHFANWLSAKCGIKVIDWILPYLNARAQPADETKTESSFVVDTVGDLADRAVLQLSELEIMSRSVLLLSLVRRMDDPARDAVYDKVMKILNPTTDLKSPACEDKQFPVRVHRYQ